jgi:hypothetical protein
MAKIVEDIIIIKFSKIAKDADPDVVSIATDEIQDQLEQIAQELVGDGFIVEVEKP